jgi:hypothetical protein
MTLIAATIENDGQRAWLAIDTLAQAPDGQRFETSKMHLLPAVPAVVAGRGPLVVVYEVYRNLAAPLESGAETFDELLVALPEIVDLVYPALGNYMGSLPPPCELAVIGWSEAAGRFVGASIMKSPDSPASARRMSIGHIAPWDTETMGPCPGPSAPTEFLDVARAQTVHGQARYPDDPIGGALELAMLTPGHLQVMQLGRLTPQLLKPISDGPQ